MQDIVQKLWNLCHALKDDGVTYHQYVTELTYLLFLKMAKETGTDASIPEGNRWDDLVSTPAPRRLPHYKRTLARLSTRASPGVEAIFASAGSSIKKAQTLSTLVEQIDKLDWYSARREGIGDLYEGLLEKNANEKKSGAGQYFTPRPLIDSIVALMQPSMSDVIQDPAAGTGGFLVAANRYIQEHSDTGQRAPGQRKKPRSCTLYGMEHVQDVHRLAWMNLLLHGIDPVSPTGGVRYGDTLSSEGAALPPATLILTNPPFGSKKGGGKPNRPDFAYPTSNKQLCFLQHIYRGLVPGGRAAVVLPDNVLFEGKVARAIRVDWMDQCNVHTVLRLPTGIFYAQGVKTNVVFFTRGHKKTGNTREVWVYDLRTDMPQFGKRTVLERQHFREFEAAFGNDPLGRTKSLAKRKDTGERGRFRKFARAWISDHDDNLDIAWLWDERGAGSLPLDPVTLAREAMTELRTAFEDLEAIVAELSTTTGGGAS